MTPQLIVNNGQLGQFSLVESWAQACLGCETSSLMQPWRSLGVWVGCECFTSKRIHGGALEE